MGWPCELGFVQQGTLVERRDNGVKRSQQAVEKIDFLLVHGRQHGRRSVFLGSCRVLAALALAAIGSR
jgi:hypothetical protein